MARNTHDIYDNGGWFQEQINWDVAIDLQAAGVDRASSALSLRLNFCQVGARTLAIDEIRLE
jgi:hypothetical protein